MAGWRLETVIMDDRRGKEKRGERQQEIKDRWRKKRRFALAWLNEKRIKETKRHRQRAEDPLGKLGVATVICERDVSRFA